MTFPDKVHNPENTFASDGKMKLALDDLEVFLAVVDSGLKTSSKPRCCAEDRVMERRGQLSGYRAMPPTSRRWSTTWPTLTTG